MEVRINLQIVLFVIQEIGEFLSVVIETELYLLGLTSLQLLYFER